MIFAVSLMAAVLAASDGSANTPQPATTQETSASAAKPDPKDLPICRRVNETGTRLGGTKICKTRQEWDLTSRYSEDAVNMQQKRSFYYTIKDRP